MKIYGENNKRLGEQRYNKQGCLMKIIVYNNANDIVVEFQDEYKAKIHTRYDNFKIGVAKNPYFPSAFGVGMLGNKYSSKENGKTSKEYRTWMNILKRCYGDKTKKEYYAYQDITCCEEWLLYENFYEWIHKQENFDKWINSDNWSIDKDILVKNNKIYSPETCCLVPQNVNSLFIKQRNHRGDLPIGVMKFKGRFKVHCNNPFTNKNEPLGVYDTPEQAFQVYKSYKENLIKQVAQTEFLSGNITEQCYKAMMEYEVEITD